MFSNPPHLLGRDNYLWAKLQINLEKQRDNLEENFQQLVYYLKMFSNEIQQCILYCDIHHFMSIQISSQEIVILLNLGKSQFRRVVFKTPNTSI